MEGHFFKARKSFDFNPHVFDLGILFMQWTSHLDMHFLNKITVTPVDSLQPLYNYHLTYYLETVDNADEKLYFAGLLELITDELVIEKRQDRRKLKSNRKNRQEQRINQYKAFLKILKTLDKWEIMSTESEKMIEMQSEIKKLKKEISSLRVSDQFKINIINGTKETVIGLFLEMIDLKNLKSTNKVKDVFENASRNTWSKIVANHFLDNGETISFGTAKNYFAKVPDTEVDKNNIIHTISTKP